MEIGGVQSILHVSFGGMVFGLVSTKIGGFPKLWVPFWSPHNTDYGILGSILGSPYSGKLPYQPC